MSIEPKVRKRSFPRSTDVKSYATPKAPKKKVVVVVIDNKKALTKQAEYVDNLRKPNKSDTFKRPQFTEAALDYLRNIARRYADAFPSDPFAYGRAFLHMRQGIETAQSILTEAEFIHANRHKIA